MLGWIDLETTGLNPRTDWLLEIAFLITEDDLTTVALQDAVCKVPVPVARGKADSFVLDMHTQNGLWTAIAAEGEPTWRIEQRLIGMYREVIGDDKVPLCGSTVHFDREFLKVNMPDFESMFHYRHIDVSTYKESFRRWLPEVSEPDFEANKRHRAADDILDSLHLAQFYRTFLRGALA